MFRQSFNSKKQSAKLKGVHVLRNFTRGNMPYQDSAGVYICKAKPENTHAIIHTIAITSDIMTHGIPPMPKENDPVNTYAQERKNKKIIFDRNA